MTSHLRIRLSVYFGVAVMLIWPVWMLQLAWRESAGTGSVLCTAVIVAFFWLIGRWDLTSYWLQYPFLLPSAGYSATFSRFIRRSSEVG